MIDINLRSVDATTSAGGGLTSLRCLCTNLNFPQPITENSYNRYIRHVETNAIKTSDRSLSDAAQKLRNVKLNGVVDDGQLIDVSVSVDGAWQKRYGFNSLVGMVFVISIDTGQVLDYVVKCLFCQKCKSHKMQQMNGKVSTRQSVVSITKEALGRWKRKAPSKCSFAQSKSINFNILFTLEMATQVRLVQ